VAFGVRVGRDRFEGFAYMYPIHDLRVQRMQTFDDLLGL
jgi:hypothetical protein